MHMQRVHVLNLMKNKKLHIYIILYIYIYIYALARGARTKPERGLWACTSKKSKSSCIADCCDVVCVHVGVIRWYVYVDVIGRCMHVGVIGWCMHVGARLSA